MNARNIQLLVGLSLMALIINIDYTAVNLALISIAQELRTTLSVVQWVLGGYILAWAAIVIPASKCSSVFGPRKVCTVTLSTFALSSLTAGLSSEAWMIISSRIVQGMSAAVFFPALYAMLFTNFPENKRGFAIGIFSLGVGTGAAIGPTFGGMLLVHYGWSWIFYINLPITAFALWLILRSTNQDEVSTQNSERLFTVNAFLLAVGLVGFLYTISMMNQTIVQSSLVIPMLIVTVISFIGFGWQEKISATKLIDWSLFYNKAYLGCTLGIGLEQFAFSASFVGIGFYLQNIIHYSVYHSSLIFLALSVVFALISTTGGMLIDKLGMRLPAILGFLLMGVGCISFIALTQTSTVTQLLSVLFVLGFGMGLVFAALNTGVIITISGAQVGIGSSVFMLFALIGNSLGVVTTTLLYETVGLQFAFDFAGAAAFLGLIVIALMVSRRATKAVLPA